MCEHLTGLEFFCDLGLSLAMRHVAGFAPPIGARAFWRLLAGVGARNPCIPLRQMQEDAPPDALRSPVERAARARIKRALDPAVLLNPGATCAPTIKNYLPKPRLS